MDKSGKKCRFWGREVEGVKWADEDGKWVEFGVGEVETERES